MGVSGILRVMEQSKCPLQLDSVLNRIKRDTTVSALWADAIGESLSAEDSEFLLREVCYRFVNTHGHGMCLKEKNKISARLRDKAPLRATLLFKK